jgi:hypothetical protein
MFAKKERQKRMQVHIMKLQRHAENQATCWRNWALVPAFLSVSFLFAAAIVSWFYVPNKEGVVWGVVSLSMLVIAALVLIFISKILWDNSNVWLGRAGTLEDLVLALKLIGKPIDCDKDYQEKDANVLDCQEKEANASFRRFKYGDTLSKDDAERLFLAVQSLERLRRTFEGELLKGPPLPNFPVSLKAV